MKNQDIFFKKNPIPMWVFSRSTLEIKAVNETALALYGYSEEEMLNLTIKDLREESEHSKLLQEMERSHDKFNNSGVWVHQTKAKEFIYVNITSSPIEWNGEACKLVVAQNVTNQKNLENLLEGDKGLIDILVQNFPGIFFLINDKMRLIRWNNNLVRLLGFSESEIEQFTISDFIPESEKNKLTAALKTAFKEGWVESDSQLQSKSGEQIPFLFKASRVLLKNEPLLLCAGANIKTLKEAESKLTSLYQFEKKERARIEVIKNRVKLIENMSQIFASEEKLSDALNKACSLLVEEVSDICSINLLKQGRPYRAAFNTAGKSIENRVNHINELYPGSLFGMKRFQEVLESGKPVYKKTVDAFEIEQAFEKKDQIELIQNLNLKSYFLLPLQIGKKKLGVLSMIILEGERDFYADDENFLTELAEKMALHIDNFMYEEHLLNLNETLEEKVKERTKQLETANKELESFSYSVSHDLRAPLRAITGYSNFLMEDHVQNLDEEGQEFLRIVHDETRRMGELIDDLLAFSRMSRTEKQVQKVSMKFLVEETIKDLPFKHDQKKPEFEIGKLPEVIADPKLIKQVWVNLLSNAVKYKTEGQKQRIKIKSSFNKEENQFLFSVEDNGVGFDMRYAEKIFEVFQRLHSDDEFEGTGIGLALVQRIIHRHGGQVWAESKLGEGSTFYFSLPAKQELKNENND